MTIALDNNYYSQNSEEQLTQKELNFFKKELTKQKEKIERSLKKKIEELNNHDEAKDEADHASIAIDNLTSNTILKGQQRTLNQIKRSLNKIALGTYGICTMCEEKINIERLKIQMFSEYCVTCRNELDKRVNYLY